MKPFFAAICFILLLSPLRIFAVTYIYGDIIGTVTWDTLNDPYVIATDTVKIRYGSTLIINAGVIVKFQYQSNQDSKRTLTVYGTLDVRGTASNPVVFTSERDDSYGGDTNGDGNATVPAPGDWGYIKFNSGLNVTNTFDYCIVKYGGQKRDYYNGQYHYNHFMIWVESNNSTYPDVTIDHCTISDAYDVGIRLTAASSIISNNTFHNCPKPIWQEGFSFPIHSNNTKTGTGYYGIFVSGDMNPSTAETRSWVKISNWPYVVGDHLTVGQNMTLEIAAGVVVKFWYEDYSYDKRTITVNGVLDVQGTATDPVVFTSDRDDNYGGDTNNDGWTTTPSPGDWGYIKFNSGLNVTNTFDYCIVKYGGRKSNNDNFMIWVAGNNLFVNDFEMYYSRLSSAYDAALYLEKNKGVIKKSQVYDSPTGILIKDYDQTLIDSCNIVNNTVGVKLEKKNNHDPHTVFTNNNFLNNQSYHIQVNNYTNPFYTIMANGNWWGVADSTTIADKIYDHYDNSSSAYVSYVPFKLYPMDTLLCPADFNASGRTDGMDLAILGAAFGFEVGQPNYNPKPDMNHSGRVDGFDLAIFATHFGHLGRENWQYLKSFPKVPINEDSIQLIASIDDNNLQVGDSFFVKISLSHIPPSRALAFDLNYDPDAFTLLNVEPGEINSNNLHLNRIDPVKGKLIFGIASTTDSYLYSQDPKFILKVKFVANGPAKNSDFSFSNAGLIKLNGLFSYPVTSVGTQIEVNEVLPDKFLLLQNYPNPFNPETHIQYILPQKRKVNLAIYDILGNQVKVLVNDIQEAGKKEVVWGGTNMKNQRVSSGIYFYRLQTDEFIETKRMLLIR